MRGNPASLVLLVLGLAAAVGLPLVNVAPNRLVSGQGVSLGAVLQQLGDLPSQVGAFMPAAVYGVATVFLLVMGLGVGGFRSSRWIHGAVVALAGALMLGMVLLTGAYAERVAQAQSPLARTSLGSAFWVLTLVLWLMVMDALHRLQAGLVMRMSVWGGLVLLLGCLLASGGCDQLSLLKEYANLSDTFAASVWRHLQIVLLTLLPTLCLGLPLAWAANRYAGLQQWLLPPLNIIQTIPSIALFGLLMVPLAWLAGWWPALAVWGVRGIGLAPAVCALTLYNLLPVVRGTLAGLAQVPAAVLEAARGMGLSELQIVWRVQLPLAAPVILAGVRTATIQTVGLAAVAALIGAGGLGSIMFDGLFGSAQDLVLLGGLPIMGLALLLEAVFQVLSGLMHPMVRGTSA